MVSVSNWKINVRDEDGANVNQPNASASSAASLDVVSSEDNVSSIIGEYKACFSELSRDNKTEQKFANIILAVISIIILVSIHLRKIEATEAGLRYNVITGHLDDEVVLQGIHSVPSFGKFILWPIINQEVEYVDEDEIVCNSKDGITVALDISFQFRVVTSEIYRLTMLYSEFPVYRQIIFNQARSLVRHVCGDFTADEYQTNRTDLSLDMERELIHRIGNQYNATITDLQLRDIQRPEDYEAAVEDKESARSDIDLATNERKGKLTEARAELVKAGQEANRILDTALTNRNVTLAYANSVAEGIVAEFEALEETYGDVQTDLNINGKDSLLNLITSQIVSATGDVVAVDSPADTRSVNENP